MTNTKISITIPIYCSFIPESSDDREPIRKMDGIRQRFYRYNKTIWTVAGIHSEYPRSFVGRR